MVQPSVCASHCVWEALAPYFSVLCIPVQWFFYRLVLFGVLNLTTVPPCMCHTGECAAWALFFRDFFFFFFLRYWDERIRSSFSCKKLPALVPFLATYQCVGSEYKISWGTKKYDNTRMFHYTLHYTAAQVFFLFFFFSSRTFSLCALGVSSEMLKKSDCIHK